MVRFGIETDADEENVAMEGIANAADAMEGNFEEVFDDTFAYKRTARVPGAYNEDLSFNYDQTRLNGNEDKNESAGALDEIESSQSTRSAFTSASMLSEKTDPPKEPNTNYSTEILTESALSNSLHSERSTGEQSRDQWAHKVTDWPSQMLNSSARFRMLGTTTQCSPKISTIQSTERGNLVLAQQYSVIDLDADLFGASHRNSSRGDGILARPQSKSIRPFLFRWSSTKLLMPEKDKNARAIKIQPWSDYITPDTTTSLANYLKQIKIEMKQQVPYVSCLDTITATAIINDDMTQDEKSIWYLVSALFDPIHSEIIGHPGVQAKAAIDDHNRKSRFSTWLSTAVAREVRRDDDRATSPAQRVFYNLTGNRLLEACSIAIAAGNYRLATLISLANGDSGVRDDLQSQLMSWRAQNCCQYVELAYRLSLELLSGNVLISEGNQSEIRSSQPESQNYNVSAELDWKRAFGLHLWYACSLESSLSEVTTSYENALSSNADVPGPYIIGCKSLHKVLDGHYQVIKLYTDSEQGYDSLFDARGFYCNSQDRHIPWLLLQYFRASQARKPSSQELDSIETTIAEDILTRGYANELELAGHWTWSILVLLHLHNSLARQTLVRSCLGRNSTSLTDEIDSFLKDELKLPPLWTAEARALKARYMRKHLVEARLLIDAGIFPEAHLTTIKHIAPHAIISGQLADLSTLLQGLEGRNIDGWTHAGQIYKDAISLLHASGPHKEETLSSRDFDHITVILTRLVASLPHMERTEFVQRVAYNEICALAMRVILQIQAHDSQMIQQNITLRNRAIQTMSTVHLHDCMAAR